MESTEINTLEQLLAEQGRLQNKLSGLEKMIAAEKIKDKQRSIRAVMEIMQSKGLTLQDLPGTKGFTKGVKGVRDQQSSLRTRKVAVKYQHPNGDVWTGRGMTPNWLRNEIANGKTREDFLVNQGS